MIKLSKNYIRKTLKSIFVSFFAIGLIFSTLNPSVALACQPSGDNPYIVIFNGRTINDDTSTWSYTIKKIGQGPRLSHWVWQPCFSLEELNQRFVSATPEPDAIGVDGATSHYGLKWEIEEGCGWPEQGMTFEITITGQPDVDQTAALAIIKAGQLGDHHHNNQPHFDLIIPGPNCAEPPLPTHSISGMKFNDLDGNGEKNCCCEPGLQGWKITIEGDQFSDWILTDQDGHYTFSDLLTGIYTVCEVEQENWQQTYPIDNLGCHLIEIIDENECGINFGNQFSEPEPEPVCNIAGIKFYDQNENGINDDELGLADWTIQLKEPYTCGPIQWEIIDTQVTDENGYYCFESVEPGDYRVEEILKEDWTNITPLYQDITLDNAEEEITVDFGNIEIEEPCPPCPYCGDGVLNTPCEECDDGENNGVECIPGYGSSCQYCSLCCQIIELIGPYCGDGILDECYEECDDNNTEDGDGCSSTCQIEEEEPEVIQPGDIVINEIMQNPDAVDDVYGEWFELYNATSTALDLNGCVIKDNGTDNHTIGNSLIIPAGGYAVLARNGDPAQNGSTTPDYVYTGFTLGNTDDEIILECNSIEIDRVDYDGGPGFPDPDGASMILAHPSLDNNDGSNWCISTSPFGDGDLGTPGSQNDSCQEIGAIISGCKYNDANNNSLIDQEEEKLGGWEIILEKENCQTWQEIATTTTQLEGENLGCYLFNQLEAANYRVSESLEGQIGWSQTYPTTTPYWEITLESDQILSDIDFANYYLVCTDDDNDGYAIEGGDCGPIDCDDTDENINPDATEVCDNQIDDDCDGDIDCDDSDCQDDPACQVGPTPECTPEETQSCDTGQAGICASGTQTCDEEGFWGECIQDNEPTAEICDNGLDDDCDGYVDGDDTDCQPAGPSTPPITVVTGGGGGAGPTSLIIFNEENKEVTTDTAILTWFTNRLATSRVVYDRVAHPSLDGLPNYGYLNSTAEDTEMVTFHTMILTELNSCTTYYWRAISHNSHNAFGDEITLTTLCAPGPPEEVIEEEITEEVGPVEPVEEIVKEEEEIILEEAPLVILGPEEEVIEEEMLEDKLLIEEIIEEEEKAEEEPTGFLAAIVNFFNLENSCWLSFLIILALVILWLLAQSRKRKEKKQGLSIIPKEKKREWTKLIIPLIIAILIILHCYFCCFNCWILLLIITIVIILFWLYKE